LLQAVAARIAAAQQLLCVFASVFQSGFVLKAAAAAANCSVGFGYVVLNGFVSCQ
jgi:hypothetical protein